MCKERPIIMGAESVLAILEGRKTQTRRVVKPQPPAKLEFYKNMYRKVGVPTWGCYYPDLSSFHAICPFGQVGDRLWVRETCYIHNQPNDREPKGTIYYAADIGLGGVGSLPTNPMFMPRWASRITLEITDIRVERLQDITEEDALAEGVESFNAVASYSYLWDSLNAKRGYPWKSNFWVWVVSFKMVKEQS